MSDMLLKEVHYSLGDALSCSSFAALTRSPRLPVRPAPSISS
jgi:hypothetical protein